VKSPEVIDIVQTTFGQPVRSSLVSAHSMPSWAKLALGPSFETCFAALSYRGRGARFWPPGIHPADGSFRGGSGLPGHPCDVPDFPHINGPGVTFDHKWPSQRIGSSMAVRSRHMTFDLGQHLVRFLRKPLNCHPVSKSRVSI
jgi:hypothetical protein